jgi:hypothetical protein
MALTPGTLSTTGRTTTTISLSLSATTGGVEPYAYVLRHKVHGSGSPFVDGDSQLGTTWTVTGLLSDTAYDFEVLVTDSAFPTAATAYSDHLVETTVATTAASLHVSYTSLTTAVADYLGFSNPPTGGDATKVDAIIQSGLRQFYWPTVLQDGKPIRWSFLSPTTTVTTVNAQEDYTLPADYGGNANSFVYLAGATSLEPLVGISDQHMHAIRAGNPKSGRPQYYGINPNTSDSSGVQQWELMFYPKPDAAYVIQYQYDVTPPALSSTYLYPYGPALHSETIIESCLAIAEERVNDAKGNPTAGSPHRSRFNELLAASVRLDAAMAPEDTPDTWPVGYTPPVRMDMTYVDLTMHVGQFMGYGWDTGRWSRDQKAIVDDIVRRGMRQFITPAPLPREKYGHEWSFLRPVTTITTLDPYETGTITVVSGVVTLAGTGAVFPSWVATGTLVIGGAYYTVATRDSNTQVTLDDTSVNEASGSAYQLVPSYCYDLPTDFADLDGPITFEPGNSMLATPIQVVGENEIRAELAVSSTVGRPRLAALRPKAIDETTWTKYELLFYPVPDDAYVLTYRYKVNVQALSATNLYPPGGAVHAETVLESCLAIAEQQKDGKPGVHTSKYAERLSASISADRMNNAPDTLGYNRDNSDQPMNYWNSYWGHGCGSTPVTYNGVAY